MSQKPSCPCCSSVGSAINSGKKYVDPIAISEPGWRETFDKRTLHVCSSCGFSWSLPYIDPEKLGHFYQASFHNKRSLRMQLSAEKPFELDLSIVSRINMFLSHARPFTLDGAVFVDFGGSDGQTAQHFKYLFPGSEVFVSETDDSCYQEYCRLRKVQVQMLESFDDESVDLIYSTHVLEHFNAEDLVSVIALFRRKLRRGGSVYIEVPNNDLREFADVEKLNEGPHLSFFSKDALSRLMKEGFIQIFSGIHGPDVKYFENRVESASPSSPLPRMFRARMRCSLLRILDRLSARPRVCNAPSHVDFFLSNPKGAWIVQISKKN